MYISKNELIERLVLITGKTRKNFIEKNVKELLSLYESYISKEERIYLEVPYKDKSIVKLLGARYDGDKKKWYIPQGVYSKNFSKWM